MTDSARTEILARIRRASKGSAERDISLELASLGLPPTVRPSPNALAEQFLANVRRNFGSTREVGNKSDAARAVADHLYQNHRTRKLVAGNDPRLAGMPWRDGGVLPRFGSAEDGDLASVCYGQLGVAQTGSIVTWTGKHNPAANSFLVEDHIVLIDREDLVVDLEEAWNHLSARIEAEGRPRGIHFISGPSGSADIDLQLVQGAHGPRSWHVILLGEA